MTESLDKRRKWIADRYLSGDTMESIARDLGLSRQRIQQIIKKLQIRRERKEQKSYMSNKYGFASVNEMKDWIARFPSCRIRFIEQKNNARQRGKAFNFTLKEWLIEWGDLWDQRGRGGDSLVMCRYNDEGAYEPGNVYIATCGQNASEYMLRRWHGTSIDRHGCPIA